MLLIGFIFLGCKTDKKESSEGNNTLATNLVQPAPFTFVFASCNDQDRPQPLWRPIIEDKPALFIWGGDNVYADTRDMKKMKSDYDKVWANAEYQELATSTKIIGTWDDHDYGLNDAGLEWEKKVEAKEQLLDFLHVNATDVRRTRDGVYYSEVISVPEGSVKFILLDTRWFRTGLKKSNIEGRRYDPWTKEEGGSVLGAAQWEWLEKELEEDDHDFTFIVSSIQFLSNKHGWEKWANHPAEVDKMYELIKKAKAPNIIILSGDRHLAEYSAAEVDGLGYPLIDFTASGMTHTFPENPWDENPYRVMEGTKGLNYGLIKVDFDSNKVSFQVKGINGKVFNTYEQSY